MATSMNNQNQEQTDLINKNLE
ncbi:unnamed protein product, partial [Rotaria sordida]